MIPYRLDSKALLFNLLNLNKVYVLVLKHPLVEYSSFGVVSVTRRAGGRFPGSVSLCWMVVNIAETVDVVENFAKGVFLWWRSWGCCEADFDRPLSGILGPSLSLEGLSMLLGVSTATTVSRMRSTSII